MKFGPLATIVAVVLLLWLFLPVLEVSVAGQTVSYDTLLAFFIGGLAGGLRFTYLKSRRMGLGEKTFLVAVAYLVATLIPLALMGGLIYLARDMPQLTGLMTQEFAATDVISFVVGYVALDAGPALLALFVAVTASQVGAAAR
ncbi:MAG: hypothetical protein AAGF09_02060 [Pseudomonadota bacterium]